MSSMPLTVYLPGEPPTAAFLATLPDVKSVKTTRRWLVFSEGYVLHIPGGTITVTFMKHTDIPEHLRGFVGYVRKLSGGKPPPVVNSVLRRVHATKSVLGCIVEADLSGVNVAIGTMGIVVHVNDGLMFAPDGSVLGKEGPLLGPLSEQ